MTFDIIVAIDENNLIGINNTLPWYSYIDQQYFKKKTSEPELPGLQNVLIMGRKTFESIGHLLVNRINCIISNTDRKDIDVMNNLDNAIEKYKSQENVSKIFVIGGSQIYKLALESPYLRYLYVTHIKSNIKIVNSNIKYTYFPCDVTSKYPLVSKSIIDKENITFCKYINPFYKSYIPYNIEQKINIEEYKYLELLQNIIKYGDKRQTRNAITYSTFGNFMQFSLENHFPILTTKRVYWKGIVEELLWFLKADTNALNLANKKVNIWINNTTKGFLKKRKLSYDIGDTGPMYGFQWKHYGVEYKGMDYDYEGQGFNQLKYCIDLLKNDPYNRRILMTTYNPLDVEKSVLAPCHGIVVQFYVENNKLSCHMYQRSSDSFLGLPFNISSYSLLVYIIGKETELKPGNLYISLGDTHIYEQHMDAVKEQLTRIPSNFPQLDFNKKNIGEYSYDDFKLINYNPQKIIKAEMIA